MKQILSSLIIECNNGNVISKMLLAKIFIRLQDEAQDYSFKLRSCGKQIEILCLLYIDNILNNLQNENLSHKKSFISKVDFISIEALKYFYKDLGFIKAITIFFIKNRPDLGLKCLYYLSHNIMKLCGENSQNFSHYTKRLILSGIYASIIPSILKMRDFESIAANLTHAINNIQKIPQIKDRLKNFLNLS